MKSLVTGAAGFIGSHLAEKLVKIGHEVIGIDCFTDYYDKLAKEANIKGLRNNKKFKFVNDNLLTVDLRRLLEKADYVFHEAAQPGVRSSFENFKPYVENNIMATSRLLDAAKDTNVKKFVYASSSSVYGDSQKLPLMEDFNPSPISPYAVSKLSGEDFCKIYFKVHNVPAVILRYFTVFGPRQRPDLAIYRIIRSVLKNDEFVLFGDGLQTRDFTFISDIIKGTIQAADLAKAGEIYNIGAGARKSLAEIIQIVEKLLGEKVNFKKIESSKGDVRNTFADISKARNAFGFKPSIDIEQGLSKQIEWMKEMVH